VKKTSPVAHSSRAALIHRVRLHDRLHIDLDNRPMPATTLSATLAS
jgi:hypothetical protein